VLDECKTLRKVEVEMMDCAKDTFQLLRELVAKMVFYDFLLNLFELLLFVQGNNSWLSCPNED